MPVQSWGHVQYWEHSDTVVTPVVVSRGGYPLWQSAPTSLVLGSVFGGFEPYYERLSAAVRWLWRLLRILLRWTPRQRQQLEHVIGVLESPLYAHAARAVRMTAVQPGFNEPQAWKHLSHKLAEYPGWAENTWRHLDACHEFERMVRAESSTVTNSARALIVELAYQDFAAHAVGSTKAYGIR